MPALSVLKQRRQALNLTQSDVAIAAGISQPAYQNYESGHMPRPSAKLKRLAKVLKLTTEEILGKTKDADTLRVPRERSNYQPRSDGISGVGEPESEYGVLDYWGDIAIHFGVGKPIVLAISEKEHSRLYAVLQGDDDFFSVYSMSNQIVGVRRAAVTDISFADEAGGTHGIEHDYYRAQDLITGAWDETPETWHIIEALTDSSGGFYEEEVVEKYGRPLVNQIANKLGMEFLENVCERTEEGETAVKDHQYTEKQIKKATALACNVQWQLSNGKVRQAEMSHRDELTQFAWLTEPGPAQDIFFDADDDITIWINPNTLDYLSIPAHSFFDERRKKTLATEQLHEATAQKKTGKS